MKISKSLILFAMMIAGLYACNKNEDFTPSGGLLPTNYIRILDSSFNPSLLIVANGNSFTFLNGTTVAHTIVSDDTTTLRAVLINPDSSYYFKPDTATILPVQINIPYHCVEHPSARGIIILTP